MATFLQTTLFQRSRPVFNICRLSAHSRNFVTDHPRPEPVVETFAGPSKYRRNGSAKKHLRGHSSLSQPSHSTPTSSKASVETFSDPARPQPYYAKHPPFRDLPRPKKRWPYVLVAAVAGVAGWAAFLQYITNQEMVSSSVVRQIMRCVKEDAQLQEVLGEAIRSQPEWWLNGDPRINGRISTLQGNIDVSWRIRGTKGSGTLYFTSIRKEKGQPFTILRFKVICDDGTTVVIDAEPV
ncbi:hypothetical protein Agabi119p4_2759 [Agaricus bisporus var. burnettii]|uniref:DUF1783-domain-containing protein n=1 Tax=Agaricus bisporus var. burnettii TaxID=192524 RepID=A0A8H7F5X4_AGABI|nr:hypothetical protein AGABI2DRAFT_190175 [Agaricus bisporus var. bisporus H97]EKV49698.1 hypothetical protein AGABI2DRAFT_190175 [Agaricus bisporus var. bisporus H97]KAF7778414.1 hypothetical protein Agabi119p4_2759 [Agaricus bisporus var. burnettii]